jgi:hypothetical protein
LAYWEPALRQLGVKNLSRARAMSIYLRPDAA